MSDGRGCPLVLVVDDDPTGRLMMRFALERAELAVVECASGEEALEVFAERQPDLVLLDVVMPGLDGFEVCRRLRAQPAGVLTPVLMLTGMDDLESIQRAYEVGATDFATKPINWVLLSHRVRYLLRAQGTLTQLRESESRLAQTQRAGHLASWEWDPGSGRHSWSAEIGRILGLPEAATAGRREYLEALDSADRGRLLRCQDDACRQGGRYSVELRLYAADGSSRVVRDEGEAIGFADGQHGVIRGTVQDVTELRAAEEQARFLADHDPLTGLPNRGAFTSWLAATLAGGQLQSLALLCVRLDAIRRVNETLGHASGDRLLADVAARLRSSVEPAGAGSAAPAEIVLGRAGGNEFLLALAGAAAAEQAARVAEAVHTGLRSAFGLEGAELFLTASIGVSVFPGGAASAELLVSQAVSAAYHASRAGGAATRFFDPSMQAAAVRRLSLDAELRRAVERGELRLFLQPQLDVATGAIVGAEALVRWQHPERGLLPPAEFVPFAEESGLILPIGDWMLRQTCRCVARWRGAGLRLPLVSVNLSSRELLEAGVGERIGQALDGAGLPPASLEVEITETTLLSDTDAARRTIADLRRRGVRVCLDDFGTGYSSLSYLKKFALDTLKIDRSFVRDVTTSRHDGAIVSAILAMAASLGLDTVTEGVETPEQLEQLRVRGCRVMQGYLFSRPLPEDEFARLLDGGQPPPGGQGSGSPPSAPGWRH